MTDSFGRLEIVYEDTELIAINKPHNLLVHKTKLAKNASVFALQKLRDQIGQRVYPAHRLDRKTSGVLLFTKTKEANIRIQTLFQEHKVGKEYIAIVRGFLTKQGVIDYPLAKEGSNLTSTKVQDAVTYYNCIKHYEIAEPFGKFSTSRYSLVQLKPTTGRFHQLRKHLSHIYHPIIGDRPHGCNKQNKLWKERFGIEDMLLHAERLCLPISQTKTIEIKANLSAIFTKAKTFLESNNILEE